MIPYIYELNPNLEIIQKHSIESFDQKLPFSSEIYYRYYPITSNSKNDPYIDIYTDVWGHNNADIYFWVDADFNQLNIFEKYVSQRDIIDEMTDRWGSFRVDCLDYNKQSINAILDIDTSGNTGDPFLSLKCSSDKTFKEIVDDYEYISMHYERAMFNHY